VGQTARLSIAPTTALGVASAQMERVHATLAGEVQSARQ